MIIRNIVRGVEVSQNQINRPDSNSFITNRDVNSSLQYPSTGTNFPLYDPTNYSNLSEESFDSNLPLENQPQVYTFSPRISDEFTNSTGSQRADSNIRNFGFPNIQTLSEIKIKYPLRRRPQ